MEPPLDASDRLDRTLERFERAAELHTVALDDLTEAIRANADARRRLTERLDGGEQPA